MNNTQQDNLTEFDIEHTSAELKKSSANLIKAMDIIQNSITQGGITNKDMETLKTIDISFYDIENDPLGLLKQGTEVIRIIGNATIKDAFNKTILFYGGEETLCWLDKENEYKIEFVRIGREINYMFEFLEKLRKELKPLVDLFHFVINPTINISLEGFFNFFEVREKADKITDLNERKLEYVRTITERKMAYITLVDDLSHDEIGLYHSFIDKCNKAIEVIDFQLQHAPSNPPEQQPTETTPDEKSDNTKEFTTRRQVLAMYYLLNELDKSTHQIDRTVKARFIEFLTGKNYDSIYKALGNPFKGLDSNNPQNAIKDMEYIKSQFEDLGLKAIAQKINSDMSGVR